MTDDAHWLLVALEGSGLGQAIRQSIWAYPAANVVHILALAGFAGSVAVMDLGLLGAFRGLALDRVVLPARRAAIAALCLLAATGFVLFTAEASHVATNPVFQVKLGLIALGLMNAFAIRRAFHRALSADGAAPVSSRLKVAAGASLAIWLAVAGCGRLIAYF